MTVQEKLFDAIRRVSSEIPADVILALKRSLETESEGSAAASSLRTILQNTSLAASGCIPACQDTGWPTMWFDLPDGTPVLPIKEAALAAIRNATNAGFLRNNAISVPGGKQRNGNCGVGTPTLHFRFSAAPGAARATILLKGGGSENQSRQYSLPDQALKAGRDENGIFKCILDAVWRAQGAGCSPGILGVCIGGDRASSFAAAKEQLLRNLEDESPDPVLASLEKRVVEAANALGIGPMGLGGRTTILAAKIGALDRHPASFFVTIAYNCWALRRISVPL